MSDLRREIDAIDDQVHDLLMRRAEIADRIKEAAPNDDDGRLAGPASRAEILRRILRRHRGSLPLRSVVRIWSEILAADANAGGAIHVCAGEHAALYRDLARTYFGSLRPMMSHNTGLAVVQACARDAGSAMGILPLAEIGEAATSWWAHLAPAGHPGPRVVARLPFIRHDGGEPLYPWAFAIGSFEQEPTGDDTTLLVLETEGDVSRPRLQRFLQQAGFDAVILAADDAAGKGASRLLLSNTGFVAADDSRLALFVDKAGDTVLRLAPVGGYANPLDEAADA